VRIPLAHLLVKSPFPRITAMMERVVACSDGVPPLLDHLVDGDQAAVVIQAKRISQLEREADTAKNEIRSHMPLRLFLPVDRRDVLRLLSHIDAIADSAEDVGVLLTHRKLEVPEEMKTLLKLYAGRAVDTVHSAADLVTMLDSLMATSFSGKAAEQAKAQIDEIARKEHEADKLQDQLVKLVFHAEERLSAVEFYQWMKVLDEIGDMANHAENVGDQFRLFIAH